MEASKKRSSALVGILTLAVLALASTVGYSQDIKVEGVIKARSGPTMILETSGDPNLAVQLTEGTSVGQVQGMFKARKKEMSMAALIPGLPVKVQGFHDAHSQLVATSVSFKGNDLERAQVIQAGMHETKMKAEQNEAEIAKHKEELARQNAELEKHRGELTEQQRKIAENKAAIEANTARFGQLDDYYIMDEVTVLFANGSSKLDPQYNSPLLALGQKAKTVQGYMIEVKGYASSSGSAAVNQTISENRANSVTNFLLQQCHIPLTNMLAPGAMGETHQVATNKTVEAEAQNRRVVVRVLQNKAIAGIE
ncbi:OmpA family protein [Edaphobacter bradus]|uniref:OmpA family protein n=1 Tax=Edaphobacter bradus TaxID=2259016 RepID=UPI0021DFB3B9|nr:OmpA family protein [Edaphobacter bradus]